jgi:hypothetical protein
MSRTQHVPLEQAATRGIRARTLAERRAALEEELAVAFAAGDRERVSELRLVLETMAELDA